MSSNTSHAPVLQRCLRAPVRPSPQSSVSSAPCAYCLSPTAQNTFSHVLCTSSHTAAPSRKMQRRVMAPAWPAGHARVTLPLMGVTGKSSSAGQRIGVHVDTPFSHRPLALHSRVISPPV